MGARCGSCLTSKTNVLRKADSSRAESHATSVVRSGVDRLPQHVIDAIMCRTPDTTESEVSKSVATIVVATCLDATSAKLSKEKGERCDIPKFARASRPPVSYQQAIYESSLFQRAALRGKPLFKAAQK